MNSRTRIVWADNITAEDRAAVCAYVQDIERGIDAEEPHGLIIELRFSREFSGESCLYILVRKPC